MTAFGDDGTNLRTYATPCGADERQLQALVHPNATHVQYRLG